MDKGQHNLSRASIDRVTTRIAKLKRAIQTEFAHKPRSLKEVDSWKATEFRLFLLYTSRTLLKGILPSDKYKNFMDLSVAIKILLSPELVLHHHNTAENLLVRFVEGATSTRLYGPGWMVYNVHTLLHLTDDARLFGSLNMCNGFPFENHLQVIKRFVKKGNNVLKQLCNRITKYENTNHVPKEPVNKISFKSPNNVYVNRENAKCYVVVGTKVASFADATQIS